MAKSAKHFVCQQCGAAAPKWNGRCESCGAWNTLIEEISAETVSGGQKRAKGRRIELVPLAGAADATAHHPTGIAEFDRVCGGGLIAGSAVLLGGDPGIGKSTLVLQVLGRIARDVPSVYIAGEESIDQIRMRALRLGLAAAPIAMAAATRIEDVLATLDRPDAPEVVVVDSIQTCYLEALDSAPGTVAQVRASAQELIRLAKRRGITAIMVGHVTKEGMIAGPKVLEHMVDTVLYFEGERGHQFRILRSVKNRFGPANEIGVFEMTSAGLAEVANPSSLFLAERRGNAAGSAVFAGIEGTRPVLVEIQALVAPTSFGTPRRAVIGWDGNRLAMVLAVLEARCAIAFSGSDVYLNVAGGLRVTEPAADLAVAAALLSAATGRPVPQDTAVFGEIGLAGEIRNVGQDDARLREASRLGFVNAWLPARPKIERKKDAPDDRLRADNAEDASGRVVRHEMAHLLDLVGEFGGASAVRVRAIQPAQPKDFE